MARLTPILTVEAIEPLLPFWTDAVGFAVTAQVPHPPDAEGGPLGFVMLSLGDAELMLQSRASVEADVGAAATKAGRTGLADRLAESTSLLFLQVDSVDEVLSRIPDPEIVVPRRTTFYGMDEIFIVAPGGALLGLAAPVESA
ncbi:MAG: hypothetical protein JSU98_00440 [Gemmatimonadales bacterium]|jgi:hypothetical protein|nr:MAG: hypothetical protein JSU98_00440 [Gemmatimonadales bacterium]